MPPEKPMTSWGSTGPTISVTSLSTTSRLTRHLDGVVESAAGELRHQLRRQVADLREGVVLPPGVVADGNGRRPDERTDGVVGHGGVGPQRHHALHGARPPADSFLNGLAGGAAAGNSGSRRGSRRRASGRRGPERPPARARTNAPLRVEHVPGSSEGGRHRAASSSESPSFVSRSSMSAPPRRRTGIGVAPERDPAEFPQAVGRTAAAGAGRQRIRQRGAGAHPARRPRPPPPARWRRRGRTLEVPSDRCLAGGDDGEQSLGQLARSVGPDLRAGVAERRGWRIAAARRRRRPPRCSAAGNGATSSVSSTMSRTNRAMTGIRHRARDGCVARQHAAVGHGRMRAVQEPELAAFERGDVIDQLDADVGQVIQPVHRPDDPRAMLLGRARPPRRSGPVPRRSPPRPLRSARAPSGRRRNSGTRTSRAIHVASAPLDPLGLVEDRAPAGRPRCRAGCRATRRPAAASPARVAVGPAPVRSAPAPTTAGRRAPALRRRRRCSPFSVMVNVTSLVDGRGHRGHAPRPARSPSTPAHRPPGASARRPGLATATVKSPSWGSSWSCARRLLSETPLISAGVAASQQLVGVDRDVGPGERAEAEVGDDRCAAVGRSPARRVHARAPASARSAVARRSPVMRPPGSAAGRRVGSRRRGARAASDHPRRCGPRRRARGHRLADHQRPGEGCTGDPSAGRGGDSRARLRAESRRPAASSPGAPAMSPSSFPTSPIRTSHRWCAPWSARPDRTISRSCWSTPASIPTRRCGPRSRCPGRSTDSSWCRRGVCTVPSARWVPRPPSSSTVPSPSTRPSCSGPRPP